MNDVGALSLSMFRKNTQHRALRRNRDLGFGSNVNCASKSLEWFFIRVRRLFSF